MHDLILSCCLAIFICTFYGCVQKNAPDHSTSDIVNTELKENPTAQIKKDSLSKRARRRKIAQAHRDSVFRSFTLDTFPIIANGSEDGNFFGLKFTNAGDTLVYDLMDEFPYNIPKKIKEKSSTVRHFSLTSLDPTVRQEMMSDLVPYEGQSLENAKYGYFLMGGGIRNKDRRPPFKYGVMWYSIDIVNDPFGLILGGISYIKIYNRNGKLVQELISKDMALLTYKMSEDNKYLCIETGGEYGEGGGHKIPARSQIFSISSGAIVLDLKRVRCEIFGPRISARNNDDNTMYVFNIEKNLAYVIENYSESVRDFLFASQEYIQTFENGKIYYKDLPSISLSSVQQKF